MDRRFSSADAFDLRPIGTLRLGGVEYEVPPLTFGRFMQLLSFDMPQVMAAVGEIVRPDLDDVESLREPGTVASLAEVVEILVPGLPRAVWAEHAALVDVACLFTIMGRQHDWRFIADAIDFGKPAPVSERQARVEEGLLAFVQLFPGHTIEEMFGLRVEGFYRTMQAALERSKAAEQRPEFEAGAPREEVIPAEKNPEAVANLQALMAEAEKRAGVTDG